MTYCVAIKVREGLVALADGRLTSGTQVTAAQKVTLHGPEGAQFMIMCSGLRSVRDKTLTYLDQRMRQLETGGFHTMFEAVTAVCEVMRQVRQEDAEALESSKLDFNLHAILGGQLPGDPEPDLYLIYPEGNWIRVGERTPYLSIGATTYGKPILDRALRYDTDLRHALKIAYLSFDSTRYSSSDVGFPIDLMTRTDDGIWRLVSFEYEDLIEQRQWWNQHITELATGLPDHPWQKLVP